MNGPCLTHEELDIIIESLGGSIRNVENGSAPYEVKTQKAGQIHQLKTRLCEYRKEIKRNDADRH
jgi:hypothetical protein